MKMINSQLQSNMYDSCAKIMVFYLVLELF